MSIKFAGVTKLFELHTMKQLFMMNSIFIQGTNIHKGVKNIYIYICGRKPKQCPLFHKISGDMSHGNFHIGFSQRKPQEIKGPQKHLIGD